MSILTRRNFLGTMAAAAGGLTALQKVVGADRSRTDPGPANPGLDAQNPDSMWPPGTDSKSLVPTFKYPFSFANKRTYEGGWSREVTVRELPVSKSMAGVNMRLTAGGVRELHWHTSAEWAIMLYGTARITAIDADGKSFVADTKKNDLWFFPSGIPHSIQGLNPDGCEFLLVFDDGDFSESETVLLSDSIAHLPSEVLSKNFGVAEQAFQNVPKKEYESSSIRKPFHQQMYRLAMRDGHTTEDFSAIYEFVTDNDHPLPASVPRPSAMLTRDSKVAAPSQVGPNGLAQNGTDNRKRP